MERLVNKQFINLPAAVSDFVSLHEISSRLLYILPRGYIIISTHLKEG